MDEARDAIPGTIDDAELIDRVVYEPSFFCNGRLAPSAFALTGKKETYISVFRNSFYDLKDIKLPKARIEGDLPAGIAQLKTNEVRSISSPNPAVMLTMAVEAKPTNTYPFHAGIFTKIDNIAVNSGNAHTNPLFMYVQKKLVRLSKVILNEE